MKMRMLSITHRWALMAARDWPASSILLYDERPREEPPRNERPRGELLLELEALRRAAPRLGSGEVPTSGKGA
jgi:hypothetical protein